MSENEFIELQERILKFLIKNKGSSRISNINVELCSGSGIAKEVILAIDFLQEQGFVESVGIVNPRIILL